MIEANSTSQFEGIISKTQLTVVDFHAEWCGPCKAIAPRFAALSLQYPKVQFVRVNVDDLKDVASKHGVKAMPTFLFFDSGRKVAEVVGADIAKVASLLVQLAKEPSMGVGRTLGGKTVEPTRDPFPWGYAAIALLVLYLIMTK